jgi:hypothetical protein
MKPPPSASQFQAILEANIKEMGLTGPDAAAFRQRYRRFTHPARIRAPEKMLSQYEADALASNIGEQLDLDVPTLKKRMGFDRG